MGERINRDTNEDNFIVTIICHSPSMCDPNIMLIIDNNVGCGVGCASVGGCVGVWVGEGRGWCGVCS